MKRIKLRGKILAFVLVDDADFDYLDQFKWHYHDGYARRTAYSKVKKCHTIIMHREIMNAPKEKMVDHKNSNRLDNRRANLRLCSLQENLRNMSARRNKHGYKGVYSNSGKFMAQLRIDRKLVYLGNYNTKEEAALAYNLGAVKYFGEFANLNEVSGG